MCNKMSDVRLSNASPTLGRVDARQPDNFRPPVRRNLFGRPDPGEIRNCAAASIKEDVQRFKDTYNYDPVAERPLAPGNYVWQDDGDAPEFYSRPPHGSQPPGRDEELPGGSSSTRSDPEEKSERQPEQPEQQDGSRKRHSGSCSCECQSKRSHTDEDDDDDDDEDHSAGSQAGEAAEEEEEEEEESTGHQ